ncbi:MAG: DUF5131 family protein [Candidatus Dormibacteraceae bacterium]
MGQASTIEWTDSTWNPIVGCRKVSAGCAHCYAERMAKRLAAMASADIDTGRNAGKKAAYLQVINKFGRWNGDVFLDYMSVDEPLRWHAPRGCSGRSPPSRHARERCTDARPNASDRSSSSSSWSKLDRELPPEKTKVLDNLKIHKDKQVQAWRAQHPWFVLHHPSVHCSWMNQVEHWFGILQRKWLAIADFADKAALAERLAAFIQEQLNLSQK